MTQDALCTQEDRDRIRAAALDQSKRLQQVALNLDALAWKLHWTNPDRVTVIVAAAQLRRLAEGA
jgi:hypothetical protein